jgi:uncharacterized protein
MLEQVTEEVRKLMQTLDDPSHDFEHVLTVYQHTRRALDESSCSGLSSMEQQAIQLAALLHEVDDEKLFKLSDSQNPLGVTSHGERHDKSETYPNAYRILSSLPESPDWDRHTLIELTVELISLVSCSSNGNSVVEPRWKLIPRDADRIEALGEIGIKRCYQYGVKVGRPNFTTQTPRAKNREELWAIATAERFANYSSGKKIGKRRFNPSTNLNSDPSVEDSDRDDSMIAHFYDRLLHVHQLQSRNQYLQAIADQRHETLIEFILAFGTTGVLPPIPN